MKVIMYKWGEYSGPETLDKGEMSQMVELGNELLGFDIRPEDKGKKFYAYPDDIDRDSDGTAVKFAYALEVKKHGK